MSRVNVLVVDDDHIDVRMAVRVLQRMSGIGRISVARDGLEALLMLRGALDHEPVMEPYVILLDLNMPKMNGIDFLRVLRRDKRLQHASVIVLTTSNTVEDRAAVEDERVLGYVTKSQLSVDWRVLESILEPITSACSTARRD